MNKMWNKYLQHDIAEIVAICNKIKEDSSTPIHTLSSIDQIIQYLNELENDVRSGDKVTTEDDVPPVSLELSDFYEDYDFQKQILKIIHDNISDPKLSIKFIAERMNITTRTLYDRQKAYPNLSIKDIIIKSRIHLATRLLSSTQLTVDEIMYKVGYDNRSTFYRHFKELHKITPTEFRAANIM